MNLKINKYSVFYEFIRYLGIKLNLINIIVYFLFLTILCFTFMGFNIALIGWISELLKLINSDNLIGMASTHLFLIFFAQVMTFWLYIIIYKGLLYLPILHLIASDSITHNPINDFFKYFKVKEQKMIDFIDFDINLYLKNEVDNNDFFRIKKYFINYDKIIKFYSSIILNFIQFLMLFYFFSVFLLLKHNMLIYDEPAIVFTAGILFFFISFVYYKIINKFLLYKELVVTVGISLFYILFSLIMSNYCIISYQKINIMGIIFFTVIVPYFIIFGVIFKQERIDFFCKKQFKLKLFILFISCIISFILSKSINIILFPSIMICIMIIKNVSKDKISKIWNIKLDLEVEDNIAKEIIKNIKK